MAWQSSGEDNNAMVSNLKRYGLIASKTVENAFREVDRKHFVPKSLLEMAHADRPLRDENIHISAPHIYASVCEALELPYDSPLSVLNVGSGTGYLTCIMASILGPRSLHYGVELHSDVVDHCKSSIRSWRQASSKMEEDDNIEIIHGNALQIDRTKGEAAFGFDRIYIGAAIRRCQLQRFAEMLKPSGILVGPVEDELIKIVRLSVSPDGEGEFSKEILLDVTFASVLCHPPKPTTLPVRVWNPSSHHLYPLSFRRCSKTLLLCANAKPMETAASVNAASMLPQALWVEIFSYIHRDWFRSSEFEFEYAFESSAASISSEEEEEEADESSERESEIQYSGVEKARRFYTLFGPRWQRATREAQFLQNMQAAALDTL